LEVNEKERKALLERKKGKHDQHWSSTNLQ